MLTPDDIKQLSAVLTTKEDLKDFYTKSEMDEKFSFQVKHMEDWIKKASVKLGVDYNP
jgi:hypothetical protein